LSDILESTNNKDNLLEFIYLKTELNKDIETKKWIQVELKVELNNSVIKFENPGENLTSGMNQTCFHD
jgi:hypothetical protein